jgi:hypothetical protein
MISRPSSAEDAAPSRAAGERVCHLFLKPLFFSQSLRSNFHAQITDSKRRKTAAGQDDASSGAVGKHVRFFKPVRAVLALLSLLLTSTGNTVCFSTTQSCNSLRRQNRSQVALHLVQLRNRSVTCFFQPQFCYRFRSYQQAQIMEKKRRKKNDVQRAPHYPSVSPSSFTPITDPLFNNLRLREKLDNEIVLLTKDVQAVRSLLELDLSDITLILQCNSAARHDLIMFAICMSYPCRSTDAASLPRSRTSHHELHPAAISKSVSLPYL